MPSPRPSPTGEGERTKKATCVAFCFERMRPDALNSALSAGEGENIKKATYVAFCFYLATQISAAHRFVREQRITGVFQHHAAVFQHVAAIGELQRLVGV